MNGNPNQSVSRYAMGILERGPEAMASETQRLVDIIEGSRALLHPTSRARAYLDIDLSPLCDSSESQADNLDRMQSAIVSAQRHVDTESKASVHLFLGAQASKKWPSYGAYRRSWDSHLHRCLN